MKNMKSSSSKAPVPSKILIDAVLLVLTTRAAVECLRPVVDKIKADLLEKHTFIYTDPYYHRAADPVEAAKPKRLTDFEVAYQMPEADSQRLYELLEAAYVEAGFIEGRECGQCPLLIAQSLEIKATHALIEVAQGFHEKFNVGDLSNASIEMRREYVEIVIRYVGQFADLKAESQKCYPVAA